MPKAKTKPTAAESPDPDKLERQGAGSYRSGDGRFEVRQSDANWYLVDLEQANEFGQELIHGPFGSMKEARGAMPGARDVKPLLKSRPRRASQGKPAKAAPPPPTWIDRLTASEAAEVRRLVRALERDGIKEAENLVRLDREGNLPVIATRLLERRIEALIQGASSKDRKVLRDLARDLFEIFTAQGERNPSPLPGWALVEIGPDRQPTKRRLRPGG